VATCGVLLVLSSLAACGKKGPPLPPLRVTPARIEDLTVSKVGNEVHARFTLPLINENKTQPVDLVAVELYAISGKPQDPTGQSLSSGDFLRYADLAGRLAIKPIPKPGDEQPPVPPPVAAQTDTRPSPGQPSTITETLGEYKPFVHPRTRARTKPMEPEVEVARPLGWPPPEDVPSRVYVAVGINSKGDKSAGSNRVTMPLIESPQPPGQPTLVHAETAIGLAWTAPPDARLDIQRAPAPAAPPPTPGAPAVLAELPARPIVQGPPGTTYNVYSATKREGQVVISETPLFQSLTGLQASMPLDGFGTEKCFVVRSVRTFGTARLESEPSPLGCITPVDTFPPAPPKNLVAVGSEGGVSLIWDPNTDKDLGGYLVLRGDVAADGTASAMKPLMSQPIKETTYRDTTARAGARHVYAVVAVDTMTPANVSAESNRVEEGAR
jgi:predicted small lipoprotein YifL